MPVELNDLDVAAEAEGLRSALIIPCYLCPAVTVAVREKQPFIKLFSHFLKSPPFEKYIRQLQSDLSAKGIESKVFASHFIHQWFMCIWTGGRRSKLKRQLGNYDAAIVLGCDSATETVRQLVDDKDCKVIQGMEIIGFMNAKMTFQWPCNVSFEDCKMVPIAQQQVEGSCD